MSSPETVTGLLGADHDRLDGLLQQTYDAVERDPEQARNSFKQFADGLNRHIEVEDDVLFPAFEQKTGMHGQGPTAVMRNEHREIESYLERIEEGLTPLTPEAAAVRGEIDGLRALLGDHNVREENILYPACDQMLDADAVRSVATALRRR